VLRRLLGKFFEYLNIIIQVISNATGVVLTVGIAGNTPRHPRQVPPIFGRDSPLWEPNTKKDSGEVENARRRAVKTIGRPGKNDWNDLNAPIDMAIRVQVRAPVGTPRKSKYKTDIVYFMVGNEDWGVLIANWANCGSEEGYGEV
jgi:hypothetical protein